MDPLIETRDLHLLRGRYVYMRFLCEPDREILRSLARDERLWEYTKTLLLTETYDEQFDHYFNDALAFAAKGDQAFAVIATAGDRVIGMTRAYDLDRRIKK